MNSKLYRLRNKNKLIGYEKRFSNHSEFSKDLYGWSTDPISSESSDPYAGFSDKHQRKLFENDIIRIDDYDEQFKIVASNPHVELRGLDSQECVQIKPETLESRTRFQFVGIDADS